MSLIKCRVCKGTGYAALIADRGRPTSICGECGGSGTEETGCEECARLTRERDEWMQQYELLVRTNQHAHMQLAATLTKLTRELDEARKLEG